MKKVIVGFLAGIILGVFTTAVFGGNTDNKNSADRALQGSGRINPSTLGMEIDIPLGSYPGRGINVPINLSYSSKVWRLQNDGEWPIAGGNYSSCYTNYIAYFSEETAAGWTNSLAVPYIEYTGAANYYKTDGSPISYGDAQCPVEGGGGNGSNYKYIRRLVVHLPGGETHELRADDTAVSFFVSNLSDPNHPEQPSMWNATFYAVDGSNLKYVQNSATNMYRLLMPDGSFYDFTPGTNTGQRKATRFTDRNGNFTTYYEPGSVDDQGVTHPNGYWKDTLGRNLSIPLKPQVPTTPTTAQNPEIYKMPGMTGEYKLHWKKLKGATQAESALTDISSPNYQIRPIGDAYGCTTQGGDPSTCVHPPGVSLFSGGGNGTGPRFSGPALFNPVVLAEIELPTGQKYKFTYDIYGRIEKVIYPTGGVEVFQYNVVPTLSKIDPSSLTANGNFGVTDRKVYPTASQTANYHWTYSASYVSSPQGYKVTINNPDGTRSERILHQGNDYDTLPAFGYDNNLAGMAFEERSYDSSNPRKMMSKKLTTWTKTGLSITNGYGSTQTADWHPRVTQEESQIFDTLGTGISATTKYEFESETALNLRETPLLTKKNSQYAFVAVGSALPSTPIRTSETTFAINDSGVTLQARDAYKAQNMVGLASASVIKDGSGTTVSRSEMLYDEQGDYSIITGETTTNWQNPNNIYRGNPTTSRVWDNTKGAANITNAYIATHARFDNFGNQRQEWDAKVNLTETDYSSPSGQDYKFAYPTKVTSAVPDPTNANGSNTSFITTATFNPITGLPLTTTDANGLETRIEYDPVTLRPLNTKTFYQGTQVGGMSESVYHDEPNNYWVKSRALIDTGKWVESISYFDGLGRSFKAEEINSDGNIFVEKEFDAEGRIKRVSNPYRLINDLCYQNNQIVCWTTNVYDEASRIKEVILPDGAKVKTDYGVSTSGIIGVTKQITDQASKQRKGISDALGRMIRVIEDPNGLNLSTDYVFDTLDNLRKTTQGEQNRYFTYDSLGRLLRAKQPEQEVNTALALPVADPITGHNQWSVSYEYDNNGNITKTTDPRGIFVTGAYDNINRLKRRIYSDSTPAVDFYYDGRGLSSVPNFSKGKTTRVASSVSETRYTGFDNLGRLLTSEQRTPFGNETAEAATPSVFTYQYNLTALVSETYPSGRTVSYEFNNDGDLSRVAGQMATGAKTYANSFNYNSSGAAESLRLGNGKWETVKYNERQQITQIGLGHSVADASLLKINYDYGTNTQNNGSLREQRINYMGLSSEIKQSYTYDDLNRLKSATETFNSGANQSWKQTFDYDRYGNRTFNAANTTTLSPSLSWKTTNPVINTSDNRLKEDQDNDNTYEYDYDKNGSVTLDAENQRFIYNADNRLKEFFKGTNSSQTPDGIYYYDGNGQRVKKVTATEITVFVYNGSGALASESSTDLPDYPKVSYLTADHLGSPRIVTDATGAVVSRHDYMAFGDEVTVSVGNVAGRTSQQGYGAEDEIRKQYTGYERDEESGLDYAQARYYNSKHGRFTSVDPLTASANVKDPQTFNRYTYAMNSPYKFTDPLGLVAVSTASCGTDCFNNSSHLNMKEAAYMEDDDENDYANHFVAGLPAPPPEPSGENPQEEKPVPTTLEGYYKLVDELFGVGAVNKEGSTVIKPNEELISKIKYTINEIWESAYRAGVINEVSNQMLNELMSLRNADTYIAIDVIADGVFNVRDFTNDDMYDYTDRYIKSTVDHLKDSQFKFYGKNSAGKKANIIYNPVGTSEVVNDILINVRSTAFTRKGGEMPLSPKQRELNDQFIKKDQ